MKNKILSFLVVIMLVTSTVFGSTTNTTKTEVKPVDVHFISTGNSDSILISDNNKYALIDGADNDDEDVLVDYLKKQGVKELEYLILTHPDADHCGGLDAVVKNFKVNNVFVGNGSSDTKTYKDFISACMNKKLQPSVPLANKEFKLGNGIFKFYNQKANSKDVNDNSLVALYTNGDNKFLFTGDAGVEVEKALPLDEIGKIDVLKVGHHGSKTSTSDAFVKAISPKYAVICCGKDNKYGHPHQETSETLSKYKVTTYRTDLNGTIVVKSDQKNISVMYAPNEITQNQQNSSSSTSKITTTAASSTVYVTKTGKKYHRSGCASLSKSKIKTTKDDAKKKGYTACSKCNP